MARYQLATISELYYRMTDQGMSPDWMGRINSKAITLSTNACHWIEFGARRRYSAAVEDAVVSTMRGYSGFLGTSNPHLAHKWDVTAHGTYAHQAVQAMMALYGVRMANKMWMKHWAEIFEGDLGITLTDTFTTEVFLRDFGRYESKLFDGARQDSSNPYAWGHKMLQHYNDLDVLTSTKRFVFSDALKVGPPGQEMIGKAYNYVPLDIYYRQFCWPVGGIGTFLTNDVGVTPLNIVIKLMSADFGHGPVDVVKLSDEPGKYTGNPDVIAAAKKELRIT
jgi:nicotinate phosphoribosyltransferase